VAAGPLAEAEDFPALLEEDGDDVGVDDGDDDDTPTPAPAPAPKKHKKKAPSAAHIYSLLSADVLKGERITPGVGARVRLPRSADADVENDTGLPRTLVVSCAIPQKAPSLMGGSSGDAGGECYQLVLYFRASVESLRAWRDSGSAGYALFRRWVEEAPGGDLPLKERLKLIVKMDNLRDLGKLGASVEQYNGKPVLLTKSGSLTPSAAPLCGPDGYLEVGINTFRFAYLTKKGMHMYLPSLHKLHMHVALTIEGRDNAELPEQALLACRLNGLDFAKMASPLPPP